ncbi:MAG: DUF433 domain-containing protein [Panacagrimonas sp.]
MNWNNRIETDPEICGGRPRIKGTRLTVEFLLGLKAAGWSEALILENYPHVTDDDLRAVFAFVQALIEEEKYVTFPKVA